MVPILNILYNEDFSFTLYLAFYFKLCVCVFGIEWLLPKRFLSGLLGFPGNFAREAKVWLDLGFSESLDICGI